MLQYTTLSLSKAEGLCMGPSHKGLNTFLSIELKHLLPFHGLCETQAIMPHQYYAVMCVE